jgi:hypothetical protein
MARSSFPRRHPSAPSVNQVLSRWGAALRTRVQLDHPSISDITVDLAETVIERPDEVGAALDRFGRRMGGDGWTLSDVAEWIDCLAEAAGPAGGPLRTFDAGIRLGEGWSSGYLRGLLEDGCTDPLTGLVTLPVLGLRLRQVHEQCEALGVAAAQVYGLVVVDVDLGGRPPLLRHAARVVVADRIAGSFRSGETVCETGGPFVALVSRTPALAETVAALEATITSLAILETAPVMVWVEDLPRQTGDIDEFLLDLAGR